MSLTPNQFPGEEIDPAELLRLKCDVLIPAALGGVINEKNAGDLRCEMLVEAANQPTTIEADKLLSDSGVVIVPDILANAGGVMGSYFEWTQNIQEFSWPIEKFRDELDSRMAQSFSTVNKTAKKYGVNLRTAAMIVAVGRVAEAVSMRGALV
ncbi:MAG: hypothetical protein EBT44_06475 [Actinobacteria bacterium]|uniref:Glutamate/phenylalanine/leucine/valine/L-tryptophan dehydrogenase C-terminal domain-containing protein n=1 Tax=Candidatus Fonsibacter lacus TaxID=2576439 RepID=A0A965LLG2_9PROT|nr:hypothetical protein [Candidatus Fonsibacter lacus]